MIEDMIREVNFNENGLVPAIAQDARSGDVLMLAWMNREAIQKTVRTGKVHYWSRSRQKLWMKGETSGNTQSIISIRLDCDGDALLLKVLQKGPACHTGQNTCFYTGLTDDSDVNIMKIGRTARPSGGAAGDTGDMGDAGRAGESDDAGDVNIKGIISDLYELIANRYESPREGSYTSYLFEKGIDKILKKLGEEATEVVIASKNDKKDEMVYEISDLLYHLLVLMVDKGISPEDICRELKRRRKSE